MDNTKKIDIPPSKYKFIYDFIKYYIPQFKQAYNETRECFDSESIRLAQITNVRDELKNIIWSGWYGEKHTARNVDWKPLKGRDVYYIIRKPEKNDYLLAYRESLYKV